MCLSDHDPLTAFGRDLLTRGMEYRPGVEFLRIASMCAALAAASCATKAPPASAPASPDAGASTVTMRIAVVGPLSKSLGSLGQDNVNGVKLALDEPAAKNLEIGGKRVVFVVDAVDDEADPGAGQLAARRIVATKPSAVLGHLQSGVTMAAMGEYAKAAIPVISGSATSDALTDRRLGAFFRTIPRDDQQGIALATFVRMHLKRLRIAVVSDGSAYGRALADKFRDEALILDGMVVYEGVAAPRVPPQEAVREIVQARAEAVLFAGLDDTLAPLLVELRKAGSKAVVVGPDGSCTEEVARLAGAAAEGFHCSQPGRPADEASRAFDRAFTARFGPVRHYAPYYHDAALALVEAARRAQSVEPRDIARELHRVTVDGATGPLAFDARGDRRLQGVTISRMTAGRLETVALVEGRAIHDISPRTR
jgi:branched-chain amino acid transport system substrate-binding protein